jgi:apolipoprotein N-acyltransferase
MGGGGAGLFLLARTRPRLAAVLWAGVWAFVVAGLVWIGEALLSGGLIMLEVSGQAAILPLLAASLTWAAAYWWYRRHPLTTAPSPPASKPSP